MRRFVLLSAFLLPLPFAAMPLFSVLVSPSGEPSAQSVQVISPPGDAAQWSVSLAADHGDCDGPAPQVQAPTGVQPQDS